MYTFDLRAGNLSSLATMVSCSDSDPGLAVVVAASIETYMSAMSKTEPSRDKAMHAEIMASITMGNFIDTRFYLPTRRRRSGAVTGFRPVYANSTILCREIEDIDQSECYHLCRRPGVSRSMLVLRSGFSESILGAFNDDDKTLLEYVAPSGDFGYDSDSDLEDDDDDDDPKNEQSTIGPAEMSEVEGAHKTTEGDATRNVEAYTPSRCSHRTDPTTKGEHGEESRTTFPPNTAESKRANSGIPIFGKTGRTVVLRDTAFKTYAFSSCNTWS